VTIVGKWVGTFAEATHALPIGMHMSADYPFMLPKIVGRGPGTITIQGRDGVATLEIRTDKRGEFCTLKQSSTFERMFRRRPTAFRLEPFKDELTPVEGGQ
jgi:hypothetical protein